MAERLRITVGLGLLAAMVAALAVPLAIGSTGARIAAVVGLLGVAGGCTAAARAFRLEHADDAEPPTAGETVRGMVRGPLVTSLGILVYLVVMLFAFTAPGSGPRQDSGWAGPVLASAASLGLIAAIAATVRGVSAKEGIERKVNVEAAGAAFVVTVLAGASYGSFEVLADAPRLSMWWVWTFGAIAYFTVATVLRNRVT